MPTTDGMSALNLDFEGHDTLYATHGLHAYGAKCPPQLVRFGVTEYSRPGETVLDPMVGSGTTLVESRLLGRDSIGYDIDPLACLVARVKATIVDDDDIVNAAEWVLARVEADLQELASQGASASVKERAQPPRFPRQEYWFSPEVSQALALLRYHIVDAPVSGVIRDFLWVVFSSLILCKVSVANARDIIHSRHHHVQHVHTPDVVARFRLRLRAMRRQLCQFSGMCSPSPPADVHVHRCDARTLPLSDESVDLVLTSPPYATALDYPRAHYLAVAWMQSALGMTLEEYMSLGASYIGSERGRANGDYVDDSRLAVSPSAVSTLAQLAQRDLHQVRLVARYFVDIHQAISEMVRVLRTGRHVVVVVCPSNLRKVEIPTHRVICEMNSALGLRPVGEYTRTISARRRLLPYMREAFGERMKTEYVLVSQKV